MIPNTWYRITEVDYPKDTLLILCNKDWPPARLANEKPPIKVGGFISKTGKWNIFGASWIPTHCMLPPESPED